MRRIVLIVALALSATALRAQDGDGIRIEIRPFIGASIPTGDQSDVFNTALLLGAQAAVQFQPNVHVVGSIGWTSAETKLVASDQGADILQYDIGLEAARVWQWGRWQVKPFLGLGGGVRNYFYDSDVLANRAGPAGYGTLGSELQLGRAALRLEVRDYFYAFKGPFEGDRTKTRNDIAVAAGLAYHFRVGGR